MKKSIIRKVWQAWARYNKTRWQVASKYKAGILHTITLDKLCEDNDSCHDALLEWYTLSELAEELKIDWINASTQDEETAKAAAEHDHYGTKIYRHTTH